MLDKFRGYFFGIGWTVLTVAILLPFRGHMNTTPVALGFLLVVLFTATRYGRNPAFAVSILSVLCFNFFFTLPYYTRATDTLAGSVGTYAPLKGREKNIGVFGVRFLEEAELIEPEQLQMLEKVAAEIGGSLESTELSEAAGRATALMEAERLKNLVLRSFSYDLAEPSREIHSAAEALASKVPLNDLAVQKALGILIEKSNQISRVAARLPQFLRDFVPTASQSRIQSETLQPSETSDAIPSSVLPPDRILFFSESVTKDQILESLVQALRLPNANDALRSIKEREEVGGILIRPNVAIPHTTIDNIDGVKAALGIQRSAENSEATAQFWMLFVSGSDSIKEHLLFLKDVAQTFSDEVLNQLATAKSSEDASRVLIAAHEAVQVRS
jgi:mannitol/fructose-specific phosphotransferase system IIA component (Ntr-type)